MVKHKFIYIAELKERNIDYIFFSFIKKTFKVELRFLFMKIYPINKFSHSLLKIYSL